MNKALGFFLVIFLFAPLTGWCGGSAEAAAASSAGGGRGKYLAGQGIIIPPSEVHINSYIAAIDYNYPDPPEELGVTLYSGHRYRAATGQHPHSRNRGGATGGGSGRYVLTPGQDGWDLLIFLDVNILIYAFRRDTDNHAEYRAWLEEALVRQAVVGISELVLSSVVRISTHPKIFVTPSTLDEVFHFTEYIRSRSNVISVVPGRTHWSIFQQLCSVVQAKGNLVTDAYLAALSIEKGAEWITSDRDFSRFPGLKWRSPLST